MTNLDNFKNMTVRDYYMNVIGFSDDVINEILLDELLDVDCTRVDNMYCKEACTQKNVNDVNINYDECTKCQRDWLFSEVTK